MTVTTASKPDLVAGLRSTWRQSAEHKVEQLWRFLRIFVAAFGSQLVEQVVANGFDLNKVSHLDQKAIVALLVAALEATWRQLHPALTSSAVDSAAGATIVPAQVDPDALPEDPATAPDQDPGPDDAAAPAPIGELEEDASEVPDVMPPPQR